MKLTLTMIAADETKTTKSFDKIPDDSPDAYLKAHANKYKKLTNQVLTTAKKIVTSDVALS